MKEGTTPTPVSEKQAAQVRVKIERVGFATLTVVTGSMEPVIKAGSPIVVTPVRGPLKRFDIIVFWNRRLLECHLIWHINSLRGADGQRVYVTKSTAGDEDIPIEESQIIATVVSHRVPKKLRLRLTLQALARKLRTRFRLFGVFHQ